MGAAWNAKLTREDRRQALRSETPSTRSNADCPRVTSREKHGHTVGLTAHDMSQFSREGAGKGTENAALCARTQLTQLTSDLSSRSLSIHPGPPGPDSQRQWGPGRPPRLSRLQPSSKLLPPRWPQELSPVSAAVPGATQPWSRNAVCTSSSQMTRVAHKWLLWGRSAGDVLGRADTPRVHDGPGLGTFSPRASFLCVVIAVPASDAGRSRGRCLWHFGPCAPSGAHGMGAEGPVHTA